MTHERSQSLKNLGSNTVYPTDTMTTKDDILERFETPMSAFKGTTEVHLDCLEFSALCPKTKQPDMGKIDVWYHPDKWCVESKSMKMFLFAFRNEGHFHEEVVTMIHDKLAELLEPKWLKVKGTFNSRGGIAINPVVESGSK